MIESDEVLVIRSRQGDRPAFEELVRRTARLVFSRIYLETGDPHRTEDLVQETFMTAWKSIRQVTDEAGFRSWLFSVAHTTVIDAARRDGRKKRTGPRADESQLKLVADTGPEPPVSAELKETRERAIMMLKGLPEEYRMALTLRYIGGADYDTIGKQLGLSNGSLRGMLSRGLSLLRERMGLEMQRKN